jgi:uncharacterized membrane protein
MMTKSRLEAFSDGVIAIIITIMVLELKTPHGDHIWDLLHHVPIFCSYLLSFVFVGIYWNNHHHLFQAVKKVNGRILWANMHLLFWLSLIPFATSWIGETTFSTWPMALYGWICFMSGVAYYILARVLMAHHEQDSPIAKALGKDIKGKFSLALYALGILLSFLNIWLSCAMYVLVALWWLVPDKRIEKILTEF